MAGDPLYDTTYTSIDWGNTTSTVSYSTSTEYDGYYNYNIIYINTQSEEYLKKIKELLRKEVIKNMKASWNELKKEFKPVPKIRPAAQLRGVCFSGRGWA